MKAWTLIVSLAVAGPACAVPPVLFPEIQKFVQAYIDAEASNDLSAYASLFSPDAKIASRTDPAVTKAEWIERSSREFIPNRQVRFRDIFADGRVVDGQRWTRVIFVESVTVCFPNRSECFPTYRTETVTARNGLIVDIERSADLHRRFTPDGSDSPLF